MAALNLREPVSEAIEAFYERSQSPADHPTLRASEIGDECDRRLWFKLRWALPAKRFPGRILRLFETGHREEARIIGNLRSVGVVIADEQRAIDVMAYGWLTGSIDGIATNVPGAPVVRHLVECKTHNDASWKAWRRAGVKASMPKHYAQMQVYMQGLGLTRALYAAHNKDTDDLEFERVEYDPVEASRHEARAVRISSATHAPPRLSEKPDYWACKLCDFRDLCHGPARARAHCRTCIFGEMTAPNDLGCSRRNETRDARDQAAGCPEHLYLPALIQGEQIDANEARGTITYRMRDGSTFIDGEAA